MLKLEHLTFPDVGQCLLVMTADAPTLEAAVQIQCQSQPLGNNPSKEEVEDMLANAVNHVLNEEFPSLYQEVVSREGFTVLSDPDFGLRALNRTEGFCATAEFYFLPPLELGRYTDFVQPIQPHPLRPLTIELEVNQHHNAEFQAANEEGRAILRQQVTQELYQKRCEQARFLAERALINQLGKEVSGALPRQLVHGNYFSEQRRFNLRLQANHINFDQYLAQLGLTVEQFRQQLHDDAEQGLRSKLGLLLVAQKENLFPSEEEILQRLSHWDNKIDGEPTFPANDRRRTAQKLASQKAEAFILAHSTLLPPPQEPVLAH